MMNEKEITIEFEGEDKHPEDIKFSDLIDVLKNLNKVLQELTATQLPETKPSDIDIRITSLEPGSLMCGFTNSHGSAKVNNAVVKQVREAIRKKDLSDLPFDARKPLRRLFDFQNKEKLKATYVTQNLSVQTDVNEYVVPADISIPSPAPISEFTTFYAEVIRVGSQIPKAKLMLFPRGGDVTADFINDDRKLAQKISNNLYKTVVLDGIITWDEETGNAKSVTITDFVCEFANNFEMGIKVLSEVAGEHWSSIDGIDEYIRKIRE